MFRYIYSVINDIFDFFVPPSCIICGALDGPRFLCDTCVKSISFIRKCCSRCSLPDFDREECPDCSRMGEKPIRILSLFLYEGVGEMVIKRLKFDGKFSILHPLEPYICERLEQFNFDFIVPVPSYIGKFVRRGYNPSFFLARLISKVSEKPVLPIILKVKDTPSQLDLSFEERLKNPRGAFRCFGNIPPGTPLIVDDVATTCTTIFECAQSLWKFGEREILAFALARTPRGGQAKSHNL